MSDVEDSLETLVMLDDHGDGSADATVQWADEDHRFSVNIHDSRAQVEYEETLSWRGVVRVKEPEEEVFRELMASDAMTEFLNSHDLKGVRRAKV